MTENISRIRAKALQGERLSRAEGLWLYEKAPMQELFALADEVKRQRHGDQVFWVNNRQINYTNVCVLHCRFCAFSKIKKDSPTAYDWDHETVFFKAQQAIDAGARELHIVGGLHPDHGLDYYLEMLSGLRDRFPQVCLKAFTAVEIHHFAKQEKRPVQEILERLKQAGLQALPGGGAEILVPGIREEICGEKESGAEWLAVHRAAHQMDIPTNATMLFGHIETYEHRLQHMEMIRELEDESPGFFAFIPLVFHPENNALGRRVKQKTSEEDRLRTIAVARLFLDNIPHIKAYWIQLGIEVARQAIRCGASDLDGTIQEEKITLAAGSETGQGMTAQSLMELIRSQGCTPVERDALYHTFG